ncbi:geraniol 8-hydroxylase-like [Carica papaya]|uniref:geraniol 8-hydroxylase-like n=1 Tax=Carica papaya TaxID=3649 RepID=UPI000B8CB0FF|nr:geraniol 8-hydroxylase-like [Carica papaya]
MEFIITALLFLLGVSVLFNLLRHHSKSRSKSKSTNLPPGPKSIPIIGNLLLLGQNPHRSLAKLAKTHGPIMTLKLGQLTTILVSSPAMAKHVIHKNDVVFSNRTIPDAIRAHQHDQFSLVWLPLSKPWSTRRKICNSYMFSVQKLDANRDLRRKKVDQLLADVRKCCLAGQAIDIGQAAFTTMLNLMSNTFFSLDLADPSGDTAREFKEIVGCIMEGIGKTNLADFFPVLRKFDIQGIRRRTVINFGKFFELSDRMIIQRLESRKKTGISTDDFLDSLLSVAENSDEGFDRNDIKHLLLDLLLAGTDTTSNTIEWAMAELLKNPETLTRARVELQEKLGKGKVVEESDISGLTYLQAIVKETFRLHPIVPFLHRKAGEEVEICGFTVPKDAQVLVNIWAVERDESVWENPNSFQPERFMEKDVDIRGKDSELIPFGGGRRICPGLPLATKMLHLMLASLLHSFDWKLEEGLTPLGTDMEEKFGLTLHKAQPLLAIPQLL